MKPVAHGLDIQARSLWLCLILLPYRRMLDISAASPNAAAAAAFWCLKTALQHCYELEHFLEA